MPHDDIDGRDVKQHVKNDTIGLRTVETDDSSQVILEQKRQRWLSPKYLLVVLENMDGFNIDEELEDIRQSENTTTSQSDETVDDLLTGGR